MTDNITVTKRGYIAKEGLGVAVVDVTKWPWEKREQVTISISDGYHSITINEAAYDRIGKLLDAAVAEYEEKAA